MDHLLKRTHVIDKSRRCYTAHGRESSSCLKMIGSGFALFLARPDHLYLERGDHSQSTVGSLARADHANRDRAGATTGRRVAEDGLVVGAGGGWNRDGLGTPLAKPANVLLADLDRLTRHVSLSFLLKLLIVARSKVIMPCS